jgi:HJR/Mrr/RecB family endonuclease
MQASDLVFHEIDSLLAGRIGSPLGSAGLRSAVDEAINFRYPNKIPPGYHDTDKLTDLAAAGDYLLWWETLTRARNDSTIDSVLLVTSDSKPDWWEVDKKGKVVGPRPELVQEMRDEANKSLMLASLADLLDGAERYLLADVSQETVQQVREVQAEVSAASSSRVEAHASGFVNLPDMSPMELEGLIALLLQAMGYSVNGAPTGADRGADFIARDDSSIVPGAIVIEVKRYRKPVAANIVRQTLGIMHSVGASRGLIIAIGGFTRAAIEEASRASIRLIGGRELAELLHLHLGIVTGIGDDNGDNHGETYE